MAFVGTVIASELLGVISKVDVEGKKITVIEKGTDKEVVVTINDDTKVAVKKKGEDEVSLVPVDFEKLETKFKKSEDQGEENQPEGDPREGRSPRRSSTQRQEEGRRRHQLRSRNDDKDTGRSSDSIDERSGREPGNPHIANPRFSITFGDGPTHQSGRPRRFQYSLSASPIPLSGSQRHQVEAYGLQDSLVDQAGRGARIEDQQDCVAAQRTRDFALEDRASLGIEGEHHKISTMSSGYSAKHRKP